MFFVVFKSPTHLNHYITSQHIYFNYYITIHRTHIVYLCVHFSAYFLAYIAIFILLFKVVLPSHLRHCMFVFSHTSQYDFTHISQHILRVCIRVSHMYLYFVFSFTSHFILTHLICFYTRISLILSKPFLQYLYCIRLRFTHIWFWLFIFKSGCFTHICTLFFENIRI